LLQDYFTVLGILQMCYFDILSLLNPTGRSIFWHSNRAVFEDQSHACKGRKSSLL